MKKFSFSLAIFALMLFACSEHESAMSKATIDTTADYAQSDMESAASSSYEDQAKMKEAAPIPEPTVPRKVIKNADFRFEVKDIYESSSKIESLVKDHGGYIVSMNQATSNYHITNDISIRVPNQGFEKLLHEMGSESIFTNYKKINSKDVTEEFVDVQSRLKTKKEVHAKYVDLLRNKAKTVEDVLKAENAIRYIQEEIESKEGRLLYLQNKTSLSTINLSVYQKVDYKPSPVKDPYEIAFLDKLKKSFLNGWNIVLGVLLFSVNIWPFLLVGGVVLYRRKAIVRRISKIGTKE